MALDVPLLVLILRLVLCCCWQLRRLQYESLASLYDTKDASILAQKSLDMSVEDGLSTTPAPVTLNPQLKAKEMEAEQVEGAAVPQEAILEQLQRQRQDLEV